MASWRVDVRAEVDRWPLRTADGPAGHCDTGSRAERPGPECSMLNSGSRLRGMRFWRKQAGRPGTPANCSSSAEVIHKHVRKPTNNGVSLIDVGPIAVVWRARPRCLAGTAKWKPRPVVQMLLDVAFVGV